MAGARFTAGFGSNDKRGQEEVGEFLRRHQGKCRPLKFMDGQDVPDGCKDEGSP